MTKFKINIAPGSLEALIKNLQAIKDYKECANMNLEFALYDGEYRKQHIVRISKGFDFRSHKEGTVPYLSTAIEFQEVDNEEEEIEKNLP